LRLHPNDRVYIGVVVSSAVEDFSTNDILLHLVDFTGKTALYSQSKKSLKTRGAAELRAGKDVVNLVLNFGSRNRSGGGVL
jgi:hypothetical protein